MRRIFLYALTDGLKFYLNPEKILEGHKPKVQKNKVVKEQGASNQEESKDTQEFILKV